MRVLILKKDRTVKRKNVNPNKRDFEDNKSLYILSPDRIQNYISPNGGLRGAQIIFFEDNPNGLSGEDEPEDKSALFLDDIVKINFIQQATDTFGKWEMPGLNLSWLWSNPSRLPMILMFLIVAWTLLQNYLSTGSLS
jgi:hypothetical protein